MPRTNDVSIVLGPPPSRDCPIPLARLTELAAVRADVELRTVDSRIGNKPDVIVVDPTGKVPGELLFYDGRLQIRDPEPGTLDWMLQLAAALGGRVVDNTCRTYRSAHETYVHPDDRAARARLAKAVRKARKLDRQPVRRRRPAAIWGVVAVVILGALLVLSRHGR